MANDIAAVTAVGVITQLTSALAVEDVYDAGLLLIYVRPSKGGGFEQDPMADSHAFIGVEVQSVASEMIAQIDLSKVMDEFINVRNWLPELLGRTVQEKEIKLYTICEVS